MKHSLLAILLLASLTGMGQSKKPDAKWDGWPTITDTQFYQVGAKNDTAWIKGDTLDLGESKYIHFIKIGKKVYGIVTHETTIEEVKKPEIMRWNEYKQECEPIFERINKAY